MIDERVIGVCADDFGIDPDIDGAIFDLIDRRRLTTVSCLVGGATWVRHGPRLAHRRREGIELGLHLDLTLQPLDGQARPLPALIAGALLRQLDRAALRREVECQLDAFEDSAGRPPDHVDGHQHVHQLPQVRDALLDALARRYVRQPPWLRSTRPPPGAGAKAWLIDALGGAAWRKALAARGWSSNEHLLGVHGFRSDAFDYELRLARWLQGCRSADLLMCHPGWCPGSDADALRLARGVEWLVLAGEGFHRLLAAAGITLLPLREQRQRPAAESSAPRPAPGRAGRRAG
ncbi:MAG: ChbG/HpnK family deacetylase [Burkholderiales bacterium]|nr:ChbG/HpnK family deacetylase [Burkholderiales bacterium]